MSQSHHVKLETSIECVLFDLDGTLIDTAPDFTLVVNKLLAEHNKEALSHETIHLNVSNGARALVKNAFDIDETHDSFADLLERLLDLYFDQLDSTVATLYPGLDDLLSQLEEQNIPWGIVTNKPEKFSVRLLEKLHLSSRCSVLVCPDHVTETKPHPEPILLALEKLGCDSERTVYLGDHIRDIQAAKNADVIAIAAAYGYLAADAKVEEWYADFILQSSEQTTSLLNLLKFA
ncbi:MAG: HAD-IA family hydrolase [Gammaproteobacteria bacterium]|nr:HAD-IA family hydrolase [Gammaproteobacteria bacterium]